MARVPPRLSQEEKALIRRYLIWCYKTTKESLDKIDRYFTQLLVDRHVLRSLEEAPELCGPAAPGDYRQKIADFKAYMNDKEQRVQPQKYADSGKKTLKTEYWYLQKRLGAIEKAIGHFLGAGQIREIKKLYEEEMTRRILEAREH